MLNGPKANCKLQAIVGYDSGNIRIKGQLSDIYLPEEAALRAGLSGPPALYVFY